MTVANGEGNGNGRSGLDPLSVQAYIPPVMATQIRFFLCAAALIVSSRALAQSDEDTPPVQGHVLLLANDRILEGDITQIGQQYCIARDGSGQTWLPCPKARRLFESRDEAFQYLRTQANLDDPDERLRLARWCIQYEMWQQAQAELKAADRVRPKHAETLRLSAVVERTMQHSEAPPTPTPLPIPRHETTTPKVAFNGLELNRECMGIFARRVQPILMNTCACCHVAGKSAAFKLAQVIGDAPATGISSQQNLTAVLSQIKPSDPMNSPLLHMAATAHGGAGQPPLRNRDTPAYRTLEQWVKMTAAHAPKAAGLISDPRATPPQKHAKNVFESVEAKTPGLAADAGKETPPNQKEVFAADAPNKNAEPFDEFDPIIFNRQMHPEKK